MCLRKGEVRSSGLPPMSRRESSQSLSLRLVFWGCNELAPRAACHYKIKFVSPSGVEHRLGLWARVVDSADVPTEQPSGTAPAGVIPTCTLRGHSKMGERGHRVKKRRIVLKS